MVRCELIKATCFLARTLIYDNGIVQLQVVRILDDAIEISPFDVETPATVFEDYPVALIDANAVTASSIDALVQYTVAQRFLNPNEIATYLRDNNLLIRYNNKPDRRAQKAIAIRFVI